MSFVSVIVLALMNTSSGNWFGFVCNSSGGCSSVRNFCREFFKRALFGEMKCMLTVLNKQFNFFFFFPFYVRVLST